jgi:hypothetical protein
MVQDYVLFFDHLTKNNRLFGPLLEYYVNPNFIVKFTMENVNEFPMSNIEASIEYDLQLYPPYRCIISLPLLVQFVILFGPLPRPVKTGTHLLILSNKRLKLGRRFFNARKSAKTEKIRESLIDQFS